MRRAVNAISPAVMEHAGAAPFRVVGGVAPDRVIKTLSILPGAVQVPQKRLCYKEKTSVGVGVRAESASSTSHASGPRCYEPDITYRDDLQSEYGRY